MTCMALAYILAVAVIIGGLLTLVYGWKRDPTMYVSDRTVRGLQRSRDRSEEDAIAPRSQDRYEDRPDRR